jgi:DNA-binding response OmpR family regulator
VVRLLPGLCLMPRCQRLTLAYSRQDALFPAGHHVKWRHFGCLCRLDEQFYRDDHLFVHLRHEVVMLDGQSITLTRNQYCLLVLLLEHPGEVVPRAIVSRKVLGFETRRPMVKAQISGLRRKLGIYGDQYIETVPRVGYRFRPMPGAWGSRIFFTVG